LAITGPICARACNLTILLELDLSGHHDWPVMAVIRPSDEHAQTRGAKLIIQIGRQ